MAIEARLHTDDRSAERYIVDLDGTIRSDDNYPNDVKIHNLSVSGFEISTTRVITLGQLITVGAAGIRRRRALVVRQNGERYGCEFLVPMTFMDLINTTKGVDKSVVSLPRALESTSGTLLVDMRDEKLPIRSRALLLVLLIVLSWTTIIALSILFIRH